MGMVKNSPILPSVAGRLDISNTSRGVWWYQLRQI